MPGGTYIIRIYQSHTTLGMASIMKQRASQQSSSPHIDAR